MYPVHVVFDIVAVPVEGVYGIFVKAPRRAQRLGERRRAYQRAVAEGADPCMQDPTASSFRAWGRDVTKDAISIPGIGSTGNPLSVPTQPVELVVPIIQGAVTGLQEAEENAEEKGSEEKGSEEYEKDK